MIQKIHPFTRNIHSSIWQCASHLSSLFSHCLMIHIAIHLISGLKWSRLWLRLSLYKGQNFSIWIMIQKIGVHVNGVIVSNMSTMNHLKIIKYIYKCVKFNFWQIFFQISFQAFFAIKTDKLLSMDSLIVWKVFRNTETMYSRWVCHKCLIH